MKPLYDYQSFAQFAADARDNWRWRFEFCPKLLQPFARFYFKGGTSIIVHGDMSVSLYCHRADDSTYRTLDEWLGVKLRPASRLNELLPEGATLQAGGHRLSRSLVPTHHSLLMVRDGRLLGLSGCVHLSRVGYWIGDKLKMTDAAPRYIVDDGDPVLAGTYDAAEAKRLREFIPAFRSAKAGWEAALGVEVGRTLPSMWHVWRQYTGMMSALIMDWSRTGELVNFRPDHERFKLWHMDNDAISVCIRGLSHREKAPIEVCLP